MAVINRFVPEVVNETINGQRVRIEIDGFNIGFRKLSHYSEREKYVKLVKEVFVLENVIGKIAKVVSKVEFTSTNASDKVVAKLNNPNLEQSKEEFLKEFTVYLKAAGWCPMWKRFGSFGVIDSLELINLDPDRTDFATNGDIVTEYNGREEKIERRDVIIFYDSIRLKDGKGYSKIKPLRSQVDNILDAQRAKNIQIENSGTTIVSPKAMQNANNVDEGLNGLVNADIPGQITQKQQIEDRLNTRGIENRIIVANKGLDAKNLSAELNGFDFNTTVESDILSICDAFGVSVELTPWGKNATFDNKEIAELSLLENEAAPIVSSLVTSLNQEFKGKAEYNFNHINAMSVVHKRIQEANGTTISQYLSLLQQNVIDLPSIQQILKDKGIIA